MFLHERIALITGASRGIGAATAQLLAQRGAWVVVSARTAVDLGKVSASIHQKGGEALVIPGDVVDPTAVFS